MSRHFRSCSPAASSWNLQSKSLVPQILPQPEVHAELFWCILGAGGSELPPIPSLASLPPLLPEAAGRALAISFIEGPSPRGLRPIRHPLHVAALANGADERFPAVGNSSSSRAPMASKLNTPDRPQLTHQSRTPFTPRVRRCPTVGGGVAAWRAPSSVRRGRHGAA